MSQVRILSPDPMTKVKRKVVLEGIGTELELGKVTAVDTKIQVIYFEKMKDGKWRMTYSKGTIPEISDLEALRIVREN